MVDWIGLVVPLAYLSILIGSLATFSSLYRKRKAARSSSLEPWFPPHLQRDIYLSLLHLEPEPTPGKEKPPTIPDSVLKAALLRRATEDIHRVFSIRSAKQALSTLLQRGSVGDDLWQRFLRAEKEIEAELKDVVEEANALSPNWGATIFQSANEIANNELTRTRIAELQAQGKADREWWDKERASIQSKFMKELDEDATATTTGGGLKPSATTAPGPVAGEKGGSDEDAVLVEGGGPAASGSTVNSAKGGGKKRKGKK
ncbi:translocation protein S66 [Toensbergia leucococca]|nr:translocation protein S66 [Toensbergia leucococca]